VKLLVKLLMKLYQTGPSDSENKKISSVWRIYFNDQMCDSFWSVAMVVEGQPTVVLVAGARSSFIRACVADVTCWWPRLGARAPRQRCCYFYVCIVHISNDMKTCNTRPVKNIYFSRFEFFFYRPAMQLSSFSRIECAGAEDNGQGYMQV
jgi:hypothetical protein